MGKPSRYAAAVIAHARQMLKDNPSKKFGFIDIYHDDWCAIFNGKSCDCNPSVVSKIDNETD